ncbi:hypothetical protein FF1_019675 [Malus domestica]|uniref:Mediator of RNA polymerase II transcription subunit 18 n=1 Tax=Malus domestica TaxID=3750 RepID=A0A498HTB4_MALDO|nr:hypothetical protein DVH24_016812 [Malus domestica]
MTAINALCHHHRSSLDFSKLLNSNTETPILPLPLSPSFHLSACAVLLLQTWGLRKCEIKCTKFMECVVQGIIETQHVEALEILLQGLCGVSKKNLRVHEICLKNGPNLGLVASEVRLVCDIEQSEQTEPTWTIRHIGGAMRGAGAEQLSVLVRSVVESKTSKNVLRFFYALGYKLDHELLRVGFSFHFQRGTQINVTVSSVNKMLQLHDIDAAVPVTPGIQLVEVTAPATSENYAEVVAAVSSFSEYLAPLLHLSKPGTSTGVVPTAAAAAASLLSDGGGTTL